MMSLQDVARRVILKIFWGSMGGRLGCEMIMQYYTVGLFVQNR